MKPYLGQPLLDANRRPLSANHVIKVQFHVGTPSLSLYVDVVVVDHLPYSCIVGTTFLSQLDKWGVDNTTSTLHLNTSMVHVYDSPQHDGQITLISCSKTSLAPGESKLVKAITKGPGISPYRPITEDLWMYEGLPEREARSLIRVSPSLNVIGTNNDTVVDVLLTNTSAEMRSVGKGVKIANAHKDFDQVNLEESGDGEVINSVVDLDVVNICVTERNSDIFLRRSTFK